MIKAKINENSGRGDRPNAHYSRRPTECHDDGVGKLVCVLSLFVARGLWYLYLKRMKVVCDSSMVGDRLRVTVVFKQRTGIVHSRGNSEQWIIVCAIDNSDCITQIMITGAQLAKIVIIMLCPLLPKKKMEFLGHSDY